MTDLEILQILTKAKELKVTMKDVARFKKQIPQSSEKDIEELKKVPDILADLSDDEIMYFATPYFDELQAKKQQKVKED